MFGRLTGKRIAQIKCDDDYLDIIKDENLHCSFNGSGLLSGQGIIPVVGMVAVSSCRIPDTQIKIKTCQDFSNMLNKLLDTISESDQVKVKVLKQKPDEMVENTSIEGNLKLSAFEEYRNNMDIFSSCFEDVLSLSDTLVKTELPMTMWGVKKITKDLNEVQVVSKDIDKESFEIITEQSDNRLGQVKTAISHCEYQQTGKEVIKTAIDYIINGFFTMKKMMAKTLLKLNKLYNINKLAKKCTGYPATWFFDPSVYYNFTERYKDMSDHLVEAARSEFTVIRPLYNWKVKVIGE